MFEETKGNGYVGSKRSVNSQYAIDNYELPLSKYTKENWLSFINEYYKDDNLLKSFSMDIIKFVAKEEIQASSWHHTSSFYNKTNHYDMNLVAEYIIKNHDSIKEEYKKYLEEKSKKNMNYSLVVFEYQVWGGSRKHPKLVEEKKNIGILVGAWIYDLNNKKHKASANKINYIEKYDSFSNLTKKNSEFKGKIKQVNALKRVHLQRKIK